MHINDLPASVPIAISADSSILAIALQLILPPRSEFLYHGPIHGSPRSGRVLALAPATGLVAARLAPASYWAQQILELTREARYDPPSMTGGTKAWEIRLTKIGGQPAAVAWAAWLV